MLRLGASWRGRSDGLAPPRISATYLALRCEPSADPVHAPHGCEAPSERAGREWLPTRVAPPHGRRGRRGSACRGTAGGPSGQAGKETPAPPPPGTTPPPKQIRGPREPIQADKVALIQPHERNEAA